jgi:DNA-damage-inducible protein J
MATSVVQIRVDEELKKQATNICEELGIDLPTAVRMFLKRTVRQNGIPFSMTLSENTIQKKEVDQIVDSLTGSIEDNGMSLKDYKDERLKKYEITD